MSFGASKRQLEAERLALQELQSVTESPLTKLSLEQRQRDIEAAISEAADDLPRAAVVVEFGGKPVVGSEGIDSEFAGNALVAYQDLLAKTSANRIHGTLGDRGPVANKDDARLHVTATVHGSFGFLLEELREQPMLIDDLNVAVLQTNDLLREFGEPSDSNFDKAVEEIDGRVLGAIATFFSAMRDREATVTIRDEKSKVVFDTASIQRAYDRASATRIDTKDEIVEGTFYLLPDAGRFEITSQRGVTAGRVARHTETDDVDDLRGFVGKLVTATLRRNVVTRGGRPSRTTFILVRLKVKEANPSTEA